MADVVGTFKVDERKTGSSILMGTARVGYNGRSRNQRLCILANIYCYTSFLVPTAHSLYSSIFILFSYLPYQTSYHLPFLSFHSPVYLFECHFRLRYRQDIYLAPFYKDESHWHFSYVFLKSKDTPSQITTHYPLATFTTLISLRVPLFMLQCRFARTGYQFSNASDHYKHHFI